MTQTKCDLAMRQMSLTPRNEMPHMKKSCQFYTLKFIETAVKLQVDCSQKVSNICQRCTLHRRAVVVKGATLVALRTWLDKIYRLKIDEIETLKMKDCITRYNSERFKSR